MHDHLTPSAGDGIKALAMTWCPCTHVLQASGTPRLSKRVTAELGNVTPYIIVPGQWSQADIEYHATSVASGLAQNAGHNCIAAEVGQGLCRQQLCMLALQCFWVLCVLGWVL